MNIMPEKRKSTRKTATGDEEHDDEGFLPLNPAEETRERWQKLGMRNSRLNAREERDGKEMELET